MQEWYSGDWKEPSVVTFTLHKQGDGTQVDLLHKNVPDEAAPGIEDGWKRYYMGQIKKLLEG